MARASDAAAGLMAVIQEVVPSMLSSACTADTGIMKKTARAKNAAHISSARALRSQARQHTLPHTNSPAAGAGPTRQ